MEQGLSIEDLQKQLQEEREKVVSLTSEKEELQKTIDEQKKEIQEQAEMIEKLKSDYQSIKEYNYKLVTDIDREEEALTNNLQKRLADTIQSKFELQKQLEYEQEFFVNRLQKQIAEIEKERDTLRNKLECDTQHLLRSINNGLDLLKQVSIDPKTPEAQDLDNVGSPEEPLPRFIRQLIEDTKVVSLKLKELEDEKLASTELNAKLKSDIQKMDNENFILQQKLKEGNKQVEEAWRMVGEIERSYETISENEYNNMESFPPSPHSMLSRIRSASIESRERSASLTNKSIKSDK